MKRRWKGMFMTNSKRQRLQTLSDKCSETRDETFCVNRDETLNINKPLENESRTKRCQQKTSQEIEEYWWRNDWCVGRRIIELRHLADQLKACKVCSKPLHLHQTKREQRVGYASILYVTCECGIINPVTTGKSHRPPTKAKKGMPVYDVNTKALAGVLHSGLTYRQMNGLMSTMEIEGLHHSTMIRRLKEVDPYLKNVAEKSCTVALVDESCCDRYTADPSTEIKIGNTAENVTAATAESTTTDISEVIMKYDMGWQKRGSGRSYNSKSGHGVIIGNNTGKICGFDTRLTDCRICQKANRNELDIPVHECAKNWSGSAKAMEPDVGIGLIKSVEKQGVQVTTIIMDDDTTTMARIRQDLSHSVTKWSDINHASKHLVNSLYTLQKKHKALNGEVIKYLKKCFNYALAQTKGDEVKCKLQIKQIVPHAFGEHTDCGEWCGHVLNPTEYKHKSLKSDLVGDELRHGLEAIFSVFSQNAKKLAPGGSTKDVESFNAMVAAKAPKRCHFSASGNLNSRVACAVAQKNLGNKYMSNVFEQIGLSPGETCKKEAERRDTELERHNKYNSKRENKLRKLNNKLQYKLKLCAKEKEEGTTYKTAVATTHHSDIDIIPSIKREPQVKKLTEAEKLVFCDIETGSLSKDTDILQLSACVDSKS